MINRNRSRSQIRNNSRNNSRRNSRRNKSGGASATMFSSNNPSFAALLAAFILDDHQGEVKWSLEGGFDESQSQIYGVLPYLHLNIDENTFRKMLEAGRCKETRVLTKDCTDKGLNKELEGVKFSCSAQTNRGVRALIDSIISSITNPERFNARTNGRRVLEVVREKMNYQVEKKLITENSIKWSQ